MRFFDFLAISVRNLLEIGQRQVIPFRENRVQTGYLFSLTNQHELLLRTRWQKTSLTVIDNNVIMEARNAG